MRPFGILYGVVLLAVGGVVLGWACHRLITGQGAGGELASPWIGVVVGSIGVAAGLFRVFKPRQRPSPD